MTCINCYIAGNLVISYVVMTSGNVKTIKYILYNVKTLRILNGLLQSKDIYAVFLVVFRLKTHL